MMKLRIDCLDFGRMSRFGTKRYVIKIKPHWWSKWRIRDWEDESIHMPRFYSSKEEALLHL